MTVLKQYNTSTSQWETIVVGQPGEAGIVNGTVAPADTSVLWLDTADAESQVAVPAGGTAGQILAKTTGTDYATGWVDNPGSRNAIINGAFDFWQRGTSFTTNTFTADRWFDSSNLAGGSIITSQQTFTPGTAPVAGYEGQFFLRMARTNASSTVLLQRIEDVRSFAGQQVTMSYWAKVASGTVTNDPNYILNFGSGGSSQTETSMGSTATITTTWTRFSHTFTLPSVAGRTIGAGSFFAPMAIRVVSGTSSTIDIWGVQLEAGSTATPFKRNAPSIQAELAACQRYYWRVTGQVGANNVIINGISASTTNALVPVQNPVVMRTLPTSIDFSSIGITNTTSYTTGASAATIENGTPFAQRIQVSVTGQTSNQPVQLVLLNGGFIGFSAELI